MYPKCKKYAIVIIVNLCTKREVRNNVPYD